MLNCQNSYRIKENVWLTFKIVIITNILVRYLNPEDHYLARIGEIDKDFARKFDFKDIGFSQVEQKKKCISISVFGYENWEKFPIYV